MDTDVVIALIDAAGRVAAAAVGDNAAGDRAQLAARVFEATLRAGIAVVEEAFPGDDEGDEEEE